jgi:hypothetical protein
MTNTGFLAVWSDVSPERETDYVHWLTREHTSERLAVDGFACVRVYRSALAQVFRYFIRYELRAPQVLASDVYLARLNAPTLSSQRIMPILGAFARGGGRVLTHAGIGRGGVVAALKLDRLKSFGDPAIVERIISGDRIVAAELLETDQQITSIKSQEKSLRSGDRTFEGLLLIEGTDEDAVAAAVARLGMQSSGNVYLQVFQL